MFYIVNEVRSKKRNEIVDEPVNAASFPGKGYHMQTHHCLIRKEVPNECRVLRNKNRTSARVTCSEAKHGSTPGSFLHWLGISRRYTWLRHWSSGPRLAVAMATAGVSAELRSARPTDEFPPPPPPFYHTTNSSFGTKFLHWLLHRCEDTPSLTELHVIEAHNCEVFLYWRRVTQGVPHNVWSNDKRIAKLDGFCFHQTFEDWTGSKMYLMFDGLSHSESCTTKINAKKLKITNNCWKRTTVAERLACSPATKAIRVQSPAGSLRIFACGNRAKRCRWSAGFLRELPFPPPFHSDTAPYSYQSPPLPLKTSMLRAQVNFLNIVATCRWQQTPLDERCTSVYVAIIPNVIHYPRRHLNFDAQLVLGGSRDLSRLGAIVFSAGPHTLPDRSDPQGGSGPTWNYPAPFLESSSSTPSRSYDVLLHRHCGFLRWLLHRCEDTPSLIELHVIVAHNCEVFPFWCRVTQGVSHKAWPNDKRIAKPDNSVVRPAVLDLKSFLFFVVSCSTTHRVHNFAKSNCTCSHKRKRKQFKSLLTLVDAGLRSLRQGGKPALVVRQPLQQWLELACDKEIGWSRFLSVQEQFLHVAICMQNLVHYRTEAQARISRPKQISRSKAGDVSFQESSARVAVTLANKDSYWKRTGTCLIKRMAGNTRLAHCLSTILTCENPVTRPGIESRFALVGGKPSSRSAPMAPKSIVNFSPTDASNVNVYLRVYISHGIRVAAMRASEGTATLSLAPAGGGADNSMFRGTWRAIENRNYTTTGQTLAFHNTVYTTSLIPQPESPQRIPKLEIFLSISKRCRPGPQEESPCHPGATLMAMLAASVPPVVILVTMLPVSISAVILLARVLAIVATSQNFWKLPTYRMSLCGSPALAG
ncbi:hypothetical protein PR048_001409 [Dryococelus australis]|uniref:Uncharacterized protein n=1 Tax=Dryococelus australis TaxID=614101 RepID=A0ABQ9IHD9_9NEOP|nr:hypothetical protein PR048_001409 [Dryococelus australis]